MYVLNSGVSDKRHSRPKALMMKPLMREASVAMALAGLCWYSVNAFADPSITGLTPSAQGITHGGTLTINGQGFGPKSPARPYLWADFNNGSIQPSALGLQTAWTEVHNMSLSATEGVRGTGGAQSANSSGTWRMRIDTSGFAWNDLNQRMYLFRKTRRNFDIAFNWKVWRMYAPNYALPDMYIAADNGEFAVGVSGSGGWTQHSLQDLQGPVNEWMTDEVLLKANSAYDRFDGEFYYFVNFVERGRLPYTDYTSHVLKLKENDNQRMVMNFPVHGVEANTTFPESYQYWADDVYLDTTWARVMVCNAPTWTGCTHKEIQIPSAWTDNAITVVLNRGAFASLVSGFLYVVDANGVVNMQGYPLCGTCPKMPTAVR